MLAVVVLAGFGIALLFPGVAARLEAPLAAPVAVRAAHARRRLRLGPARRRRARLRLHAVRGADPRRGHHGQRGHRAVGRGRARVRGRVGGRAARALPRRPARARPRPARPGAAPRVQRGMGAVMLATALAHRHERRRELRPARRAADPRGQRHRVARALGRGREAPARDQRPQAEVHRRRVPAGDARRTPTAPLPKLGLAPEFTDTERWFNTPGGRPQTLASLRRRGAVLVDFWTYTCINCLRTLPYLEAWDHRYRAKGLTIVGVHTPEFAFEHDAGNVENAIKRLGIKYPVVQDNAMGTWNAYANMYWPADYLIDSHRPGPLRRDRRGRLRQDRGGDPLRARGGRPQPPRGGRAAAGRRGPVGPDLARDVPRHGACGRMGRRASPSRAATSTRAPRAGCALNALRLRRRVDASARRRPPRAPARRSTREVQGQARLPRARLGGPEAAAGPGPARRAPGDAPGRPAPTCTAAVRRSPASASTRSCRCRATGAPPDAALRARDLGFAFTFG